jgi:hypothetical protein
MGSGLVCDNVRLAAVEAGFSRASSRCRPARPGRAGKGHRYAQWDEEATRREGRGFNPAALSPPLTRPSDTLSPRERAGVRGKEYAIGGTEVPPFWDV